MRRRKKVFSRNMIEVTDYQSSRIYGRGKTRQKRRIPTPEEMKKNNARIAESRLRMLIDTNFVGGDYYLTLTYETQPSFEQAKLDIRNLMRRLSTRYKAKGKTLKYIYIVEGQKRIHFHVLINRAFEIYPDDMAVLWPYGFFEQKMYQGKAEDAIRIASYHVKEAKDNPEKDAVFKRRWTSSKNLEKPKEKIEMLNSIVWREDIKAPKGYYLDKDSVFEGIGLTGFPFRVYRLIKIGAPKKGLRHMWDG